MHGQQSIKKKEKFYTYGILSNIVTRTAVGFGFPCGLALWIHFLY